MAMSREKLNSFLIKAFPDSVIEIQDLAGDNDHFAVTVVSDLFEGKNRIQQHQMVFEALEGHMGKALHALRIKTQLPQR